jgi:hypothetical protein
LERNIVDIGKVLQKYGLRVGEHPSFGGVGGGHSPTGYHPKGLAIDVTDWRPDMAPAYEGGPKKSWKQRTGELSWRAKQLGLFNEVLGPGDKGHDTHVHLALEGKKPFTEQQLEWLITGRYKDPSGALTDVMPSSSSINTNLPASPTGYDQAQKRTDELLEAFLTGVEYKKKQQEPKSLANQLAQGLLSSVLTGQLNPLGATAASPQLPQEYAQAIFG